MPTVQRAWILLCALLNYAHMCLAEYVEVSWTEFLELFHSSLSQLQGKGSSYCYTSDPKVLDVEIFQSFWGRAVNSVKISLSFFHQTF